MADDCGGRARRALAVRSLGFAAPMLNSALHLMLGSSFVAGSNVAIRLPMVWQPNVGVNGMLADTADTAVGIATYYPGALVCYLAMVAIGMRLGRDASEASAGLTVPAVQQTPPAGESLEPRLVIREWNRVHFSAHDDIDWIEAANNHVVVHTSARAFKGRERISDVEARLDERRFVRVHRSAIVHVRKIREVQPLSRGDQAVILTSGRVVRVSRSRRRVLEDALGTPI